MKNISFVTSLFLLLVLSACKKDKQYVYDVGKEVVYDSASEKNTEKSATEFISIAYADIFGEGITQSKLEQINLPYIAFADKKLIEDLIIRNFLQEGLSNLPSTADMRADIPAFVESTYLRFYNRMPNEFELWYLQDYISKNSDVTAEVVYYGMLTSDEYRFY